MSMKIIKVVIVILLNSIFLSGCKKQSNTARQPDIETQLITMVQNLIHYDATKITDVKIIKTDGENSHLSQEIKDTKIIIYLPELGCASCYEMQLQFLQTEIPHDIKQKVFIIGKFSNYREQKLFEEKSGFTTYRVEKFLTGFPLSMLDENPTTFLLGKDMIGYAFFDASNSNNLSDLYYRFIIEKVRHPV